MIMTHGEKLRALTSLSVRSGITQTDFHDIKLWSELAGPKYDVTVLSEKSIERIDAIFKRFFQE